MGGAYPHHRRLLLRGRNRNQFRTLDTHGKFAFGPFAGSEADPDNGGIQRRLDLYIGMRLQDAFFAGDDDDVFGGRAQDSEAVGGGDQLVLGIIEENVEGGTEGLFCSPCSDLYSLILQYEGRSVHGKIDEGSRRNTVGTIRQG